MNEQTHTYTEGFRVKVKSRISGPVNRNIGSVTEVARMSQHPCLQDRHLQGGESISLENQGREKVKPIAPEFPGGWPRERGPGRLGRAMWNSSSICQSSTSRAGTQLYSPGPYLSQTTRYSSCPLLRLESSNYRTLKAGKPSTSTTA